MKPREQRRPVMIKARMRVGAAWGDVSILNISSRGLMIHSQQAPVRGAYLEVRRGRHAIVARVVWSDNQRFGVCTQDRLSVEAIICEPDRSAPEARRPQDDTPPVERRTRSASERHERSRMAGRALEFAVLGIAGVSAALACYSLVIESLGRPMTRISAALTLE